ncbi:MAG: 5'-methylthioadenosine/adenosylhomocysteine nucleosidase [Clostridia bacterium]|jgi:adenosylhomocysteine nucleosidase|nr:5'-methylthioadenosine/adenosylhomocysteine nucleosidase [Clostridia bacterium]
MIGIIGAMSVEVEELKARLTDAKVEKFAGSEYVSGRLCGREVVIAQCGIGKVFAAVCASTMILRYNVSAIINTGVAGTLSEKVGILDFAVSDAVVQHDMDTTAIGDAIGLISGINVIEIPASKKLSALALRLAREQGSRCESGIIASGDQFISSSERKSFIRDTFGAIACEMEGAAIGQVCYISDVDFVIIRCISDSATGEAQMEYPEMVSRAAKKSTELVIAMLNDLED